jgi:hypothetical protein
MLNGMADADIGRSLARQRAWGISDLDLKDRIFGKGIIDLDDGDAARLAGLVSAEGFAVHCLSTNLFHDDVDKGEAHFRAQHLVKIARVIEIAQTLRPRFVRLLAAYSRKAAASGDGRMAFVDREQTWLPAVYAEAINRLHDSGIASTIENETGDCILATPDDVSRLFAALARHGAGHERCCYTWDVQNMWQAGGAYPAMATYEQLKHLIGYYHLKGGRSETENGQLRWRSGLEDASWPVTDITRRVVADGCSPVICLNPSHGAAPPGQDQRPSPEGDITFLRRNIEGIA